MKELGESLKETREQNGVSIEEASEDINISKMDLENIEEGNIRTFKDVLQLRTTIKNYAKYLGMNPDKVLDEFNDFMFEHTSKISLKDIEEAEKKMEVTPKKITSPYTKVRKSKIKVLPKDTSKIVIIIMAIILLIVIVLKLLQPSKNTTVKELKNIRSDIYEFTYKTNNI